ncbi:MAG TPA: thrombospondin type 3 repeat-containing protein [Saprospiraceae bacterium]|nr:thrombospondin type 3 repeat-containing protein [Saprospiraceae bacterium]
MLKNHYIFIRYSNFLIMKQPALHRLFLATCLLPLCLGISAQKNIGLSFKRLFLDYQTLQGGDFGAFQDYRNGFEVGFHYPITNQLMVNVPIKIGLGNKTDELTNEHIIGADAQLHFYPLAHPKRFKPYILVGVGGVYQGKDSFNLQVPAGIGLDIKLTENAYFNIQSEFRWSSATDNNNFNHGIGFKYFFGRKTATDSMPTAPPPTVEMMDSDKDGIADEFDACPTVPGLMAFAGCPDKDGDGVQDSKDDCPDVAGLIEMHGCPDTDGDGVSDNMDECPSVAGPASNKGCPVVVNKDSDGDGIMDDADHCPQVAGLAKFAGCPDTDGDGIEDAMDKCPTVAGLAVFAGCPDTDGDGIEDPKDKCPNTYGPISNHGCPVIEEKDKETLTFAMKAVQFELGKATLKPESFSVLNQILNIMKKYPDYKLSIEGHTDNTGSADVNQKLSESRAKACYDYLAQKGIPANRLAYKGFGQTRPIADNSTYSGRTLNRRVEFNLTPMN